MTFNKKDYYIEGKIYICGGFNGNDCLDSAEYYDPSNNQWTMITPMRNRRSGVGIAAYNNHIYAMGGFNGIVRLNSCEKYDPQTNRWTPMPDMYTLRSNFALQVRLSWLYIDASNSNMPHFLNFILFRLLMDAC